MRQVFAFICALALVGCATAPQLDEPSPAARFTPAYQTAHRGEIAVSVPDVYEMISVVIALTDYAEEHPGRVPTQTDYYRDVVSHFAPVRDHPLVLEFNRQMNADPILGYIRLKLNAFAFSFDANGQVLRSAVYDRILEEDPENPLVALMPQMQSFADQSGFLAFYRAHRSVYDGQIAFFRDETNVRDMWSWLRTQFPVVSPYDGVKIVFSPLAGNIQNEVAFENNGYRELQAHINYPYNSDPAISADGNGVWRGTLLFGELNHGFINPTADRYRDAIEQAIAHRERWTGPNNADAYPDDYAVFNEYMNFGLITLYHRDRMNAADGAAARQRIETLMVENRGFLKFAEFNTILNDAYAQRDHGQTVADLYPQIIAWFAAQDAS